MSMRPDFSQHRAAPDLARYDGRVGRLFRGDDEAGVLLIELQAYAEHVGGHLWWRRWGTTQDVFWEFTIVDGRFSDSLQTGASEELLVEYEAGRFSYYGEDMRLVWLDGAEAASVRTAAFGK